MISLSAKWQSRSAGGDSADFEDLDYAVAVGESLTSPVIPPSRVLEAGRPVAGPRPRWERVGPTRGT